MEAQPTVIAAHEGAASRYRARRLARFVALCDEILKRKSEVRVLDMGGRVAYWRDLQDVWAGRNLTFTIVNFESELESGSRFATETGDVRDLSRHPDMSFDIVHSNSVIEHVGRWKDWAAMAAEVRRLAPRYFVQTPNFWFPVEPHFNVPFFHWMPEPWRIGIVMRRACGTFPVAPSVADAQRYIEDATLLDARRMQALFPDAKIERERVFGFTKSLIAVR
jgi:hypothetical protein